MLRYIKGTLTVAALVAVTMTAGSVVANAETMLRAVAGLPKQVIYTQDALRFFEKVNAAGKGVVQIQWLGGPEVIPPKEQAQALRNGVVDMVFAPANYYWGELPESAAIAGSTKTPWELRQNGGMALLDESYADKLNAHILGWFGASVGFHIYLNQPPRQLDDGRIDLSGVKVRSNPVYQDFFTKLGATNVSIQMPEVYSALERGTVAGLGWPLVGITDFNWDKYVKYRVDPSFFKSDLVLAVNRDRWDSLPENARKLLTSLAEEYEKESFAFFEKESEKDNAKVLGRGLEIIELKGPASERYLSDAYDALWARVEKLTPEKAAQLKTKFYE